MLKRKGKQITFDDSWPLNDATQTCCAYCYKSQPADEVWQKCSKCKKRCLCSRACQRADWRCGHREWCGRAGEAGSDYEIRAAPGKGLGVYALRRFERNESVLVERALLLQLPIFDGRSGRRPDEQLTALLHPTELQAVRALLPAGGSLWDKYKANAFGLPEAAPSQSVFINLSRINHACAANCHRMFMHGPDIPPGAVAGPTLGELHTLPRGSGAMRLIASRPICSGEELTIAYLQLGGSSELYGCKVASHDGYRAHLRSHYGFDCGCRGCKHPELVAQVNEFNGWMTDAAQLREARQLDAAMAATARHLEIANRLELDAGSISWLYGELFHTAVMRRKTLALAQEYASKTAELAAAYFGEGSYAEMWRTLATHPERDRECCCAD